MIKIKKVPQLAFLAGRLDPVEERISKLEDGAEEIGIYAAGRGRVKADAAWLSVGDGRRGWLTGRV